MFPNTLEFFRVFLGKKAKETRKFEYLTKSLLSGKLNFFNIKRQKQPPGGVLNIFRKYFRKLSVAESHFSKNVTRPPENR